MGDLVTLHPLGPLRMTELICLLDVRGLMQKKFKYNIDVNNISIWCKEMNIRAVVRIVYCDQLFVVSTNLMINFFNFTQLINNRLPYNKMILYQLCNTFNGKGVYYVYCY